MGLSRGVDQSAAIERIDAFCDAVPRRRARTEEHGPLVLFVPTGPGWPYYARPRLPAGPSGVRRASGDAGGPGGTVTAEDIRAVRARQRELLIPESFEWIDEAAPGMTAAAPGAGLAARAHPLMVLSALAPAPVTEPGVAVRIVSPGEPELDRIWAVPAVAFGHPGTAAGLAGAIERDKIAADHDEGTMDMLRERLRSGQSVLAAAFGPDGPRPPGAASRWPASRRSPGWGCCRARAGWGSAGR